MASTSNEAFQADEDLTLKELILKIRKWRLFIFSKWLLLVIAGVIGGLLGMLYGLSRHSSYKAELSFVIQDGKSGGGGAGMSLASQYGLGLNSSFGDEFSSNNIIMLMKSRSMIERALLRPVSIKGKTQTLAEFYIDFNELRQGWKEDSNLANIHFLPNTDRSEFTLSQDSVLGVFYNALANNNLKVDKADGGSSIITLDVTSTNELFSKNFVEVLVKVVSEFYIQSKTRKDAQNVILLQHQTDSVRRILNLAISGVASSADSNPNPNPSLQSLRVPSQRKQVDVQANSAILTELIRDLGTAKATVLQETPLIEVIDRPILPLEKEVYNKKKLVFIGIFAGLFVMIALLSAKKFLDAVMV